MQKLLCSLGKGNINTNTIIKEGITKINMNITFPSETVGFGCYTHKDTCDILSEILDSQRLQAY